MKKESKGSKGPKKIEIFKIAALFESLNSRQDVYSFIYQSNQYLKGKPLINISVFIEQLAPPCISPEFATFFMKDLGYFDGVLIVTTADMLQKSEKSYRAQKLFYIYDLEYYHIECRNKSLFDWAMKQDVVKFCRSTEHRDRLREMGYQVLDQIVPYFDIEQIIKIYKENKNVKANERIAQVQTNA